MAKQALVVFLIKQVICRSRGWHACHVVDGCVPSLCTLCFGDWLSRSPYIRPTCRLLIFNSSIHINLWHQLLHSPPHPSSSHHPTMSTPQELKPMIMRVDMKKGRRPGKAVNLGNLSEAELGKAVSFNFGRGSATHQQVSTPALSKEPSGIPGNMPQSTDCTILTLSHTQTTISSFPSAIDDVDQVLTTDATYSNAPMAHRGNNPTIHHHYASSDITQPGLAQKAKFHKRDLELQNRAQAMAPSHRSATCSLDVPSSRDMMSLGGSRAGHLTAPHSSGWGQKATALTPDVRANNLHDRHMAASVPLTATQNTAGDLSTSELPAVPIMISPQLNLRHGFPVRELPQTSAASAMKRGISKTWNTMSSTPQASGHNTTYGINHTAAHNALAHQPYLRSLWTQQATQGLGPTAFGGTDGQSPHPEYSHRHNLLDSAQNTLHQPHVASATLSSSHSLDYNKNTRPPVFDSLGIFQPPSTYNYMSMPVPNIKTQQTRAPAMMDYPTQTIDCRPSKRIKTGLSQNIDELNAEDAHQELWPAPTISHPYDIHDQPIPPPAPLPLSQTESVVSAIPHDLVDQPTSLPATQPLLLAGPSALTAASTMSLLTVTTDRLIRPLPIRATKASQTKYLAPPKSEERVVRAGQERESPAEPKISSDELSQHDLFEPTIEVAKRAQACPEAEAKPEAGTESQSEYKDREPDTTPKPEAIKNVETPCSALEVSQGTSLISPTFMAEIVEQSGKIDRFFAEERKQDRFYLNLFNEFFGDFILGNGLGVQVASWAEEQDEQLENENGAKEGI